MMEYVAEAAEVAKYIAALRMDADNMGKILHEGFYGKESLEKLSVFSRNVNNFFKLYLESLCKNGSHSSDQEHANDRNVQVIYAGGADRFILGAWSDTIELAIEIGNAFKNYTGNNIIVMIVGFVGQDGILSYIFSNIHSIGSLPGGRGRSNLER